MLIVSVVEKKYFIVILKIVYTLIYRNFNVYIRFPTRLGMTCVLAPIVIPAKAVI